MATAQNSLMVYKQMTSVIERYTGEMIVGFSKIKSASEKSFDAAVLQKHKSEIVKVTQSYSMIVDANYKICDAQEKTNQKVADGAKKTGLLKNAFEKASGAVKKMSGINDIVDGAVGKVVDFNDVTDTAKNYQKAMNHLQIQTGSTGGELTQMGESMKSLYTKGLGTDFTDVANSLNLVQQKTGQTGTALEQTTSSAMLMKDSFGFDIGDNLETARTLMTQFGLSSSEAFDQIIQGAQAGLNGNDSMLAAIQGNAAQFSELGLSSSDMFNMMIRGAENGSLSIDSLGSSIEEFGSRAVSGSKGSADGFRALGLDADNMAARLSAGGDTAKQAFEQTLSALNKMEDPLKKNAAGANLFGASWNNVEPAGVQSMAESGGGVTVSTSNLESLNQAKFNDVSSAVESLGRTINTALAGPVGTALNFITTIIQNVTDGINNNALGMQDVINGISLVINNVVAFATEVANVITSNWPAIQPILMSIFAALGLVFGMLQLIKLMQGIGQIFQLMASPIGLIVLGVILVIAVIYTAVEMFNQLTGSTVSATGVIFGAISTIGAVIGNILMGLGQLIIGVVEYWTNLFLNFANFFGNVMNDPVGSVVKLFGNMADTVLGVIQKIAEAIDLVFGTNAADTVSKWRSEIKSKVETAFDATTNGKYEDKYPKEDFNKKLAEIGYDPKHINYENAYDKGYNYGEKIKGSDLGQRFKAKDSLNPENFVDKNTMLPPTDPSNAFMTGDDMLNNENLLQTARNTKRTADSVSKSSEDLKFLRDTAERETINRFTTASIKVNMHNNNKIGSNMDIDGVIAQLETKLYDSLNAAAEGVYV